MLPRDARRLTRGLLACQASGHTLAWGADPTPPALQFPSRGTPAPKLECPLLENPGRACSLPFYCLHPGYTGLGLVAFTDGSPKASAETGAESGFAVVICRMQDVLRPGFTRVIGASF